MDRNKTIDIKSAQLHDLSYLRTFAKAWVMQCYKRLECEYAARTKEKSRTPKDATQSKK